MKPLKLIKNPDYEIICFKNSHWVRAEYKEEMIGLCMDLESAYQVIYNHIKEELGECEFLTDESFEE